MTRLKCPFRWSLWLFSARIARVKAECSLSDLPFHDDDGGAGLQRCLQAHIAACLHRRKTASRSGKRSSLHGSCFRAIIPNWSLRRSLPPY
ncbi:uncharacterized protein BCR38DRAFT_198988 [Pseudomassariella vexata]|uniref:Secreted protein n=1 Tax=Pseudomassariella vexata TaxID=1141098 RepID=A0A1Y2E2D5_9PEZI|nr:uncharacterized protein BCR38DRAFT_198988 [Pseudomassariella vexata]ORY65514.1 hypothetical protein BCR38DRAFT_198988 [Pseudomassariella vexata]